MPDTKLPQQPLVHEDADVDAIEQVVREILTRASVSVATSTQELLLDFDLGTSRFVLLRFPRAVAHKTVLSPRELEIVRMISQGLPTKVIANALSISCWTVSTHVRRIFSKLSVTSRAAMVARILDMSTGDDCLRPEDPIKTRSKMEKSA